MKSPLIAGVICAGLMVNAANAGIIEDLASAKILQDFLFNDEAGTHVHEAANSADPGNQFTVDPQGELDNVVTNGSGALNASLNNNDGFGAGYVNVRSTAITSGRVFGVMELTWDFTSTLNPAENEEIRISLMRDSAELETTFVTAEWEIQREDDDSLTILGNGVGTGSSDLSAVELNGGSLTQAEKFIAVVDADLNSNTYQVHYSNNGGASFTTMGTANLDPTRGIHSLRMVLSNNFADDNVLVDRVYVGYIPEPTTGALAALTAVALVGLRGWRRSNA